VAVPLTGAQDNLIELDVAASALTIPGLRLPPMPSLRTVGTDVVLLAAFIAAAGAGSLLLGQDANWDLQNYHYYNPWAWWHGRIFTKDLAAAQIQTFHNPVLDLPFYWMVTAEWAPRVIAFVMAIPAAIAALFLCKLLLLMFGDLPREQRMVAVASSLAIGVTSAMAIGELGSTMNEWPLAALLMLALWLIARELKRTAVSPLPTGTLLLAGIIAGLAAGAKLTAATFAVGLCGVLLGRGPYTWLAFRARFADASWFALGVIVGTAIALGPWAYALWIHFDNPIFPYGNQWIRSPWWEPRAIPLRSASFGPRNLAEWLVFPFELLSPPPFFVAEVPYRDARFPLTWALALLAPVVWLARRLRRTATQYIASGIDAAWRVVVLFVIISFILWTAQHSIYRYLVPLDLLTGALIVGLLRKLGPPRFAIVAAALVAVTLIATTRFANWGRIDFGDRWFKVVQMPPVETNAVVLITTGEAVSYIIPMLPASSRYVGALNTIVDPSHRTKLVDTVRSIVRDHPGPLYQLTHPLTEGKEVLATYHLARTTACAVIVTNMPTTPLELCRLVRIP
jgi:hypothetical protein